MSGSRIELAYGEQSPVGPMLLLGAGRDLDLTPFDPAQTQIVQGFFPDVQALEGQGFDVVTEPRGTFAQALVVIPRSRALARARLAQASALLPEGAALWVDGLKTDGIDSVLREIRGLLPVEEVHSRAHGKIFRITIPAGRWYPQEWIAAEKEVAPGFHTLPGVFSADGPDPASVALAAHLPEKMPTRVVDLGAGWGWLSAQILARPGVEILHLVEADAASLDCAKRNITDPRARFHWTDALSFGLTEPVNAVVMNPPFHEGRKADPALGAGFIRTAARLLTGAGRLWMVANRHLPYEAVLRDSFADVSELGGDSRFKILTATGAGRGAGASKKGRRS